MEVILREDVAHLGKSGEIVAVKDGYARNYLIPHGLAYQATAGNKRRIEVEQQQRDARMASQRAEATGVAERLATISLTFTVKTGEGEKLFGSITAADIAEKLKEQGFAVDKRRIVLDEPIKMVGIYKVPVRLEAGVPGEVRGRGDVRVLVMDGRDRAVRGVRVHVAREQEREQEERGVVDGREHDDRAKGDRSPPARPQEQDERPRRGRHGDRSRLDAPLLLEDLRELDDLHDRQPAEILDDLLLGNVCHCPSVLGYD